MVGRVGVVVVFLGGESPPCAVLAHGRGLLMLPPTVLQLLRFVYDVATNSKKKISTTFEFPDELDMSAYLPEGESLLDCIQGITRHNPHRSMVHSRSS